jgi:hypothetical protein
MTPETTSPPLETIQGNLQAGRTVTAQSEPDAARAYLTPMIPAAEAGLARREAWRNAPVEPRPGDDVFSRYETKDALLRVAEAQHCNDPALAEHRAVEPFLRARTDLRGEVDAIASVRAGIARIPTLSARDCQRQEADRLAGRWDTNRLVNGLANALGGMATRSTESLDDVARACATWLEQLLSYSRNVKAAGLREAAAPVRTTPTAEPETELYIKPRH